MRKHAVVLVLVALVGSLATGIAPGVPVAASVRCIQVSPSDTPGQCTYKSTVFESEVLTAVAAQGYTLDWIENGEPQHVACTGTCSEPGLMFNADAGSTIHVTVTQGVAIVRQVAARP